MVRGLRRLTDYAGLAIKVHLRSGAAFHFKVTEAGHDYTSGYDDESLNLRIDAADIDFIVG